MPDHTRQVLDRTDVGLLVVAGGEWGAFEEGIRRELRGRDVPVIVLFNKSDLGRPPSELVGWLRDENVACVNTVASRSEGVLDVREALIEAAPEEFINAPSMVSDLVPSR